MAKAILLAEDLEDDALFLQRILKKAGVMNPVLVVNDGEKAIAYLNGNGEFSDREKFPLPGILLLDLKMPRKSGYEVLEWLKTQPQLKDLLVVVVSGVDELPSIQRAYELGARSFVSKPFRPEDIINLMNAFKDYWVHSPLA